MMGQFHQHSADVLEVDMTPLTFMKKMFPPDVIKRSEDARYLLSLSLYIYIYIYIYIHIHISNKIYIHIHIYTHVHVHVKQTSYVMSCGMQHL